MVLTPETIQLFKKLGIKLGFGILGFTAAFLGSHIGLFDIDPRIAAILASLLDDVAEWANTKTQATARIARAYAKATGRR